MAKQPKACRFCEHRSFFVHKGPRFWLCGHRHGLGPAGEPLFINDSVMNGNVPPPPICPLADGVAGSDVVVSMGGHEIPPSEKKIVEQVNSMYGKK